MNEYETNDINEATDLLITELKQNKTNSTQKFEMNGKPVKINPLMVYLNH